MVKHLLSAVIIAFSFMGTAQVNAYFANDPVWKITLTDGQMNPCIKYETYNYWTSGDTIIGSYTYKKVYAKGQAYYQWMSPTPPGPGQCTDPPYSYMNGNPVFFLRSSGKKIYAKMSGGDTLLYDFNLNVGDTLPKTYNNSQNNIIVTAKDSIFTANGYMKRFTLNSNTPSQYLVEGIGHSGGLVEPLWLSVSQSWNLDCYSLNANAYFPVTGPSCMLPLGISELKETTYPEVYPNPVTGVAYVNVNAGTEAGIYNVMGEKLQDLKLVKGKNEIGMSNLPSGIYFLKADTSSGRFRQKIVKE